MKASSLAELISDSGVQIPLLLLILASLFSGQYFLVSLFQFIIMGRAFFLFPLVPETYFRHSKVTRFLFVLTTFALAIVKLFFLDLRPGRVSVHRSQFCPLETYKPLVSTFTGSPFHICLLTFSPGQNSMILSFLVPNQWFSWLMLLDTFPFASGPPKSMMSGQVPALERLRQDDTHLRQAWTPQ